MATLVRYLYQNHAGLRVTKVAPKRIYDDKEDNAISLCSICLFLPACQDMYTQGTIGNVHTILAITPDKRTFKQIPWKPTQAYVCADILTTEGKPYEGCPRSLLRRMTEELKALGFEMKIGFETEFVIANKDNSYPDSNTYCNAKTFDKFADLLEEIYESLEALGVRVLTIHKEAFPSQFEIVTDYGEPIEICDKLLLTHETISSVLERRGYKLDLLPGHGNGAHLHTSIWKDGKNITGDLGAKYGISPIAESFVGGLLQSLPALVSLTVPSLMSLERLKPGRWAGAFTAWGIESKECPVRVCLPLKKGKPVTNIELKLFDPTANFYVGVAAVVALAAHGISNKLTAPDPVEDDPQFLTPEEKERLGARLLPQTWEERKEALDGPAGDVLREKLGKGVIDSYWAVRNADVEHFKGKPYEEVCSTMVNRY